MASNEKEIRAKFAELLQSKYNGILVHEFCGKDMRTRTDLSMITWEEIIHVEIKSNSDNLNRLYNQIQDYLKYANLVYVVLDYCHLDKYQKIAGDLDIHYPVFYKDGEFVYASGTKYRFNTPRLSPLKVDIANLLWSGEKKAILRNFKGHSKVSSSDYLNALYAIFTVQELIDFSHEILYNRWKVIEDSGKRFLRGFEGGTISSAIEDIDHKNKLFQRFIDGSETE